jgi:AcrR family transcriptional regulator
MRPSPPSLLKRPVQARSVASYERLIAAARAVLEEKSFDEATVAEIATRAGLTVGAFYARFEDKESLLRHLEELLFDEMRETVARVAACADRGELRPAELVRGLVVALAGLYRGDRAVGRALILRASVDAELRERLRQLNRENIGRVVGALAASGAIDHPDPAGGLEFALLAERSILRAAILFGEGFSHDREWSDERVVEETTRMIVRYLGLETETR